MMLLNFGLIFIGSAFVIGGWLVHGWRHRNPFNIWNAALVLSLGFDLHAIGFALQTGVRVAEILDGRTFATVYPWFYFTGVALVFLGKSAFVWVAAMEQGRTYKRKLWWSYVTACLLWAGFSIIYTACEAL